jgi:uncharacterized protein YdaU (DUF1376 family)
MPRKANPKFKWFPFDIRDYLTDTMHLETKQHGAYLLLLLSYYENGPLPDNDSALAATAKLSLTAWNRMSSTIRAFFTVEDDGRLHQKRTDEELAKREELSAKRSEAGTIGAEAKKSNKSVVCEDGTEANASGLLEVCRPTDTDTDTDTEEVPSPSEKVVSEPVAPEILRAFDAWNTLAGELGLPSAHKLTKARKAAIGARLRENDGIDGWTKALTEVRESPFLRGEKGFHASIDFLCQPSTFQKTLEGNYRPKPQRGQLPLLRPIEGGKDDPWGIEAWCRNHPSITLIEGDDATPDVLEKGKWAFATPDGGGRIIDHAARQVAEAAGWDKSWRGDWSLLLQWAYEGISTQKHIVPAIRDFAQKCRARENPAISLAVFDKVVRDRKAAA